MVNCFYGYPDRLPIRILLSLKHVRALNPLATDNTFVHLPQMLGIMRTTNVSFSLLEIDRDPSPTRLRERNHPIDTLGYYSQSASIQKTALDLYWYISPMGSEVRGQVPLRLRCPDLQISNREICIQVYHGRFASCCILPVVEQ
jgi:hypothetical protein